MIKFKISAPLKSMKSFPVLFLAQRDFITIFISPCEGRIMTKEEVVNLMEDSPVEGLSLRRARRGRGKIVEGHYMTVCAREDFKNRWQPSYTSLESRRESRERSLLLTLYHFMSFLSAPLPSYSFHE